MTKPGWSIAWEGPLESAELATDLLSRNGLQVDCLKALDAAQVLVPDEELATAKELLTDWAL